MKKLFLGVGLLLASLSTFAQLGFEGIRVDKVDASAVAAGAFAYRVFVDMAPGWEMQAVYGDNQNNLVMSTTTYFYNNVDGASAGRNLPNFVFNDPVGKFDSYVTVDGVTTSRVGILISEDTDGPADGFATGTSLPLQTIGADFDVPFGTANTPSPYTFTVTNGAYNVNGGEQGLTATNRVMIGQFTTTGDLTLQLNIQIRNGATVEKYVAAGPVGAGEFLDTRLNYTSVVIAPTVSITAPASGAVFNTNDPVDIFATAADANGTVTGVAFYRNGTLPANKIGDGVYNAVDARWELLNWPAAAGASALRAIATDNDGNATTSAVVNISASTPSNDPPSVVLNVPTPGQLINLGSSVTLSATASDPQGLAGVTVEFFVNGGTVGFGTAAGAVYTLPYTFSAIGPVSVYARVSDGSLSANSSTVNANVVDPSAGFLIDSKTAVCYESEVFCMPILVTTSQSDVLGFDIPLEYERTKVQPTGVVYVKTDLLGPAGNYNWVSVYTNINDADSIMYISLAINGSAPAGTEFNGTGELICVEFAKTINFGTVNSALFTSAGIDVSKATQVNKVFVGNGTYATVKDENFKGDLKFWKDNSPIAYVANQNLITNIVGNVNCVNALATVLPDALGKFTYNTVDGARNVKIERDILATTDVQDVINGADAQLVARVIVNDVNYKPNIFQMWAMDVNRDGLVSAGDLTQIMQRTVSAYDEFKQAFNYNADGTPKSATAKPSLDWVFMPADTVYAEQFRISANWPFAEPAPGKGYSRFGLPVADSCHKIKIIGSDCPIVLNRSYLGIMLGDVNGSYASYTDADIAIQSLLKSSEKNAVVFDLANATVNGKFVDVPVYFASNEEVTSVDFAVRFDREALQVESIVKNAAGLESADFYNTKDNTLRFTSYSLNALEAGKNLVTVRFNTNGNELKSSDLTSVSAYVNGNPASLKVADAKGLQTEVALNVYPNPAADVLNVEVSVNAKLQLMDVSGRSILFETDAVANRKAEINVSGLANGNYMLKVYNNSFVKVQKVVIQK